MGKITEAFRGGWEQAFSMLEGRAKQELLGIAGDSDNKSVTDQQILSRFRVWCKTYDPELKGKGSNLVFALLLQSRPGLKNL